MLTKGHVGQDRASAAKISAAARPQWKTMKKQNLKQDVLARKPELRLLAWCPVVVGLPALTHSLISADVLTSRGNKQTLEHRQVCAFPTGVTRYSPYSQVLPLMIELGGRRLGRWIRCAVYNVEIQQEYIFICSVPEAGSGIGLQDHLDQQPLAVAPILLVMIYP